tara:strand:+ start:269 stop:592 length:324 start_codon:yes stop_codon:yes gene_type:complete
MDKFESQVSNELFTISNDLHLIKKALLSITKDIQLQMTYCDVITTILEEHGFTTSEEVRELTMETNERREEQAKALFEKVTKNLEKIQDEQESLKELLRTSPVKGEA